jgi:predicted Zn-dependent protease
MPRITSELRAALAALLALLLLGACGTLTVPQERKLGEELSREIRREVILLRDSVVTGYVERIGHDIVRAAGPQPFAYHFYVVEDDEINAFAAPAGHIYFHTETILMARNVCELAGVIAHEVGHVVKRHIAENYGRQRSTGIVHQGLVITAGVLGGSSSAGAANLGGALAGTAFLNKFGRDAEREADAFAVEVMPKAGYDPIGLVTFFKTLRSETGSGGATFLSSHPATDERIEETRLLIAALSPRSDLRVDDSGRLEIIQRRIRLLIGDATPSSESRSRRRQADQERR